jgi:hypothetical protein
MFLQEFRKEIIHEIIKIVLIPDITEVIYGRNVGWGIREIRLPKDIEEISGTKIRKKGFNR